MTAPSERELPPELRRRRDDPAPLPLSFSGWQSDFAGWHAALSAAWSRALPSPDPVASCEAGPEVVTEPGLTLTPLRLTTAGGTRIEGARLAPAAATRAAVLMLHDHGGEFRIGWRKLLPGPADALSPVAEETAARFYGGFPALALARAGHPVFCFDALGWGARAWGGHGDQQALAANALQLGTSIAGLVAAEDAAIARWIAARPEARAGLAAWGFSFGGFRAWQLLALAPDMRAAVALSWMARRRALLHPGNPLLNGQSAFWMLHPALTGLADLPDLAGAGAPKPLFLRSGAGDRHLPAPAVEAAHADLRRIWDAAGGWLDAGLFPGGHLCPGAVQAEAAAFLATALG